MTAARSPAGVPLLQVRGLSKHFGGAQALREVDLDVAAGEVHGLVGANGAGKSTLVRCLAGVITPDTGTVALNGTVTAIGSPADAEAAGLSFIHQELNLVPHFSAVENILLGAPKVGRFGLVDWKASRGPAVEAARRIGVRFALDRRVDELSVAEQWLVMIAKALARRAALIAMDEPTASLSDHESQRLFQVIRDLQAHGVAVLYVSHRLDEVLDLSDRITVFRDGRVTRAATRGELDKAGLIRAIVGRELAATGRPPATAGSRREVLLEAVGVGRGTAVKDVSLRLYSGEVLGLGGLVGAGRTEFARLAVGADRPERGHFTLLGRPLPAGSVPRAVAAGIALVPEERRSAGLMLDKSIAYNMNIAVLRSLRAVRWLPFLSRRRSRARGAELLGRLQIKAASPGVPVRSLSGGNQQKVLIGRWLGGPVRVLILDEPSRGVDVGARQEIHRQIRALAAAGVGTLVISSDVEELAILCDRVVVLSEGRVTGELSGDDIAEERIIELSYAGHQTQPQERA